MSSQNRKTSREMVTDQRRARGEIACAECRRLKLKCDRKLPCSSCVRRQCQAICPHGVLASTQAARLYKLQKNVTAMGRRIRLLEIALKIDHASITSEPHPLLTDELLEIKKGCFPKDDDDPSGSEDGDLEEPQAEDSIEADIADALGVLSIDDEESRFVGASGSEELLLMDVASRNEKLESVHADSTDLFRADVAEVANAWPFSLTPPAPVDLQAKIEAQLPPWDHAHRLSEAFIGIFCWWMRPVGREQLFDELLPTVYRRQSSQPQAPLDEQIPGQSKVDLHDFALIFIIFACGAHADPSLPYLNKETQKYRQLGCAALGLKSIFHFATLASVQAMSMLAQLDSLLGRENALESSYRLMCLTMCISTSIGLHRDPERWNLEPKIKNRRRQAFWSIYVIGLWKGLSTGKPISYSPGTIDCKYPDDVAPVKTSDGTLLPGDWRCLEMFVGEILAVLADRICAAKPPNYSEVQALDKRMNEFESRLQAITGAKRKHLPPGAMDNLDKQMLMKIHAGGLEGVLGMVFLHRGYFARAIVDHRADPLQSPFAKSFRVAFEAATKLLASTRHNFRRDREMTLRTWPIWEHAIASTIIVGSVATECAGTELGTVGYRELDLAIGVFQDAIEHPFVKHGLPILRRLRDKATRALTHSLSRNLSVPQALTDDGDEIVDLAILRGTTRVVVKGSSDSNTGKAPPSCVSEIRGGQLSRNSSNRTSQSALIPDQSAMQWQLQNTSACVQTLSPPKGFFEPTPQPHGLDSSRQAITSNLNDNWHIPNPSQPEPESLQASVDYFSQSQSAFTNPMNAPLQSAPTLDWPPALPTSVFDASTFGEKNMAMETIVTDPALSYYAAQIGDDFDVSSLFPSSFLDPADPTSMDFQNDDFHLQGVDLYNPSMMHVGVDSAIF